MAVHSDRGATNGNMHCVTLGVDDGIVDDGEEEGTNKGLVDGIALGMKVGKDEGLDEQSYILKKSNSYHATQELGATVWIRTFVAICVVGNVYDSLSFFDVKPDHVNAGTDEVLT